MILCILNIQRCQYSLFSLHRYLINHKNTCYILLLFILLRRSKLLIFDRLQYNRYIDSTILIDMFCRTANNERMNELDACLRYLVYLRAEVQLFSRNIQHNIYHALFCSVDIIMYFVTLVLLFYLGFVILPWSTISSSNSSYSSRSSSS